MSPGRPRDRSSGADQGRVFDLGNRVIAQGPVKENVFCEFLPGTEYTVDCLFDMEGEPVVIVPRKRLEVFNGKSSLGETQRNPILEDNVKKLSALFKFIGHVNIQFKPDQDGTFKLVEINPRFSGGLPITAEAGANTPELLFKLLSGEKVSPPAWQETPRSSQRTTTTRWIFPAFGCTEHRGASVTLPGLSLL